MDPPRLNLRLNATSFTPVSRTPTLRVHVRLVNLQATIFHGIDGVYTVDDWRQVLPPNAIHLEIPYFVCLNSVAVHRYILRSLSDHLTLDHRVCNYIAAEITSLANKAFFSTSAPLGIFITAEANIISTRVIEEFDDVLTELDDFLMGVWRDNCNNGGASPSFLSRLMRERRLDGEAAGDHELGECAICLDELSGAKELINLPCHHVFHEACIFRWLGTKNTCPLCQQVLDRELLTGSLPVPA